MKKCLLFISGYIIMLMISNVCKAKALADCVQTGACEEYLSLAEMADIHQSGIELDSLAYGVTSNQMKQSK